jgi:hypothetical protein
MKALRAMAREPRGQSSNPALLRINECIYNEAQALREQLRCLRDELQREEGEFFAEMLGHVDQTLDTLRGLVETGVSTK